MSDFIINSENNIDEDYTSNDDMSDYSNEIIENDDDIGEDVGDSDSDDTDYTQPPMTELHIVNISNDELDDILFDNDWIDELHMYRFFPTQPVNLSETILSKILTEYHINMEQYSNPLTFDDEIDILLKLTALDHYCVYWSRLDPEFANELHATFPNGIIERPVIDKLFTQVENIYIKEHEIPQYDTRVFQYKLLSRYLDTYTNNTLK